MALSPADKQKRYRQRHKKALDAAPDQTGSFIKRPFNEYIAELHLGLEENLDAVGIQISGSLDVAVQQFETEADWDIAVDGSDRSSSLGRATLMVGVFLDAAQELAKAINSFKLEEIATAIDAAFAASAALPKDDVEGMKAAFAEIDRLKSIQTRLGKKVRYLIPAVQVKAE